MYSEATDLIFFIYYPSIIVFYLFIRRNKIFLIKLHLNISKKNPLLINNTIACKKEIQNTNMIKTN